MYMASEMLTSAPFTVGDLGSEYRQRCHHQQPRHLRDSHAESVPVDISEIELQPSILTGPDIRADLEAPAAASEANHLQVRCVDMAMELFALKTKFDEQEKELKWAKREAETREKDCKEVQRVCEEERRSSKSFMRRVKILEEEKSKLGEQNGHLRLDKDRLLSVLRRYREAGRADSVAAHRDRIRKRHISEKEVNRCDLASAKLGLKATRQENERLLRKASRQAARIRDIEEGSALLATKVTELEKAMNAIREQKAVVEQEADDAMASTRRATSDMEHEALLRLEAVERASTSERARDEAKEGRMAAEVEAESLREQLAAATEKLEAKDSARARHYGSVARYQKMIDAQANALQSTREQLLGEKVRRQETERQARLRHIAAIDSKARAGYGSSSRDGGVAVRSKGMSSPRGRRGLEEQKRRIQRSAPRIRVEPDRRA